MPAVIWRDWRQWTKNLPEKSVCIYQGTKPCNPKTQGRYGGHHITTSGTL